MSLMDNIKANEGFSEYVYRDSLGFLIVGYGFKCDSLTSDELELNKNRYEPMLFNISKTIAKEQNLELKCCGDDINIASKLQDNVSDIEFIKGGISGRCSLAVANIITGGSIAFKNTNSNDIELKEFSITSIRHTLNSRRYSIEIEFEG